MLTNLQKSRIRYHLRTNYRTAYDNLIANAALNLDNLTPEQELELVGNATSQNYLFLGQPLCQTGSLLWKVEESLKKISPDTIEYSQFLKSSEDTEFRSNELRRRQNLYNEAVRQLKQFFGLEDLPLGLGYWGLGK